MTRWQSGWAAILGMLFLSLYLIRPCLAGVEGRSDTTAARAKPSIVTPRDAGGWLELGHTLLKQGDLKGSEKAFRKALSSERKGQKASEAYNGLGLVYARLRGQLQASISYFQQALNLNPRYVEARYNMAQTYYSHEWLPYAIQEAAGALAMDSTYAPARKLLSQCRVRTAESASNPREKLEKALKSEPEDSAGWMTWGKRAMEERAYPRILQRLLPVGKAHPTWRELLPILAQAYRGQNQLQKAWDIFEEYIVGLAEDEQALYADIRLVCSKEMAEQHGKLPTEERNALADGFWAERDPDLTTPVNERLFEHYRRVWYARTFFSRDKYPYDRRGEVYIRYGEPDHRSRSGVQNPPPTAAINAVKERLVNQLYDDMWAPLSMGQTMSSKHGPLLDATRYFDAVTGVSLGGPIVGPAFPIRAYFPEKEVYDSGVVYLPVGASDFSQVPWESWVYTGIDGGIEIDFTDEVGKGEFDYAPIPALEKTRGLRHREKDDVTALTILQHWSPTAISGRAISQTPERYDVPSEARAFGFHYDAATFRGATDSTAVEVYYGLPLSKAAYFTADGKTGLRIVCRVALAREGGGPVYRSENEMIFVEKGDLTRTPGFVPHIARIEVPPGVYRMDVRVENRLNGEVGSYRKALTVEPYPAGSLKLSDIELASRITDNPIEGKFTKQGLQVIPMPTRHYGKGQAIHLYYEIYNLKRDGSGKASYTVEYAVRSGKTSGVISQVLRSFLGRERNPEVSVRQERLGLGETEIQHIQLDLGRLTSGDFTVRVTVKDLVAGQEAGKETAFTVEE